MSCFESGSVACLTQQGRIQGIHRTVQSSILRPALCCLHSQYGMSLCVLIIAHTWPWARLPNTSNTPHHGMCAHAYMLAFDRGAMAAHTRCQSCAQAQCQQSSNTCSLKHTTAVMQAWGQVSLQQLTRRAAAIRLSAQDQTQLLTLVSCTGKLRFCAAAYACCSCLEVCARCRSCTQALRCPACQCAR